MEEDQEIDAGSLEKILSDHNDWLRTRKESGARADLSIKDMRGVDLSEANLAEAYARSANLERANLQGADLSRANFREANLRGANLKRACLRLTNLLDADLRDADLTDAQGMTEARMRQPIVNEHTKLPPIQRGKMPKLKTEKLINDDE